MRVLGIDERNMQEIMIELTDLEGRLKEDIRSLRSLRDRLSEMRDSLSARK